MSLPIFVVALVLVHLSCTTDICSASRRLTSLYKPPPLVLKYHDGPLLDGDVPVSVVWYGRFAPSQKSIISDFVLSLNPERSHPQQNAPSPAPFVSSWWEPVQAYLQKAGRKDTRFVLSGQFSDEDCSLGRILKRFQISELARKANPKSHELTIVLTAQDVAVEGFCSSGCGFHGSSDAGDSAFIWVGDSTMQCPGQCAWPFQRPIYGPQTEPLVAPNGDVGADGMVINIGALMASAVTNPFGKGFYMGSVSAPIEVGSACTGSFGKGSYPGYAGELLVDLGNGASYNAVGVNGRKYLLPALLDPETSQCRTIV
ncbi:hypothetical protein MLD38_034547 [Melastoma candidum]|uniref:Uncharacterized protein n=1 Tax=Melastoma candidum TaxID=119954 RepID=A0ACB9MA88_9MYRT|nr:hypothetical protein MLD38_034547 [Melastoma candidum]